MDDRKKPPIVFANKVIRQFVDHYLGEHTYILPADYTQIRVVFRWCKGSWESLVQGDILHTRLMVNIVKVWCKLPGRKRETEMG